MTDAESRLHVFWGACAVSALVLGFITAGIYAHTERGDRREAKQACFAAGYTDVLRAGDDWYCSRRRAGSDEVVEVAKVQRVGYQP